MRLNTHGGGCCGIRHLYGMGMSPEGQHSQCWYREVNLSRPGANLTGRQAIHRIMEEFIESHPDEGRIIEVTLTDGQDRGWAGELTNRGFVKAARFLNHNTRNFVNIWYYYRSAEHNLELFGTHAPAPAVEREAADRGRPFADLIGGGAWCIRSVNPTNGDVVAEGLNNPQIARTFHLVNTEELNRLQSRDNMVDPLTLQVQNLQRAVDAREERRHILSTWHCEYRGGRRGAGYDSREAAQRANPRARRIVERRIYSDGTTDFNIGE